MTKPSVVVFVHGILGGVKTWAALQPYLEKEPYLNRFFDLEFYNYASPVVFLNPLKRIPDFGDIANGLITALRQDKFSRYSCVVLVGHSQGGLIIQRMLVDAVRAGRATEDLARIRGVVLLATPNAGSELFLSVRTTLETLLRQHPQEKNLRPFNEEIASIHATLLERVIYAQRASSTSRPIRFDVYTGSEDGVVPRA
jgi:triacylglycerol esterase/lipase EstA (alpha/beta hydrolase family)